MNAAARLLTWLTAPHYGQLRSTVPFAIATCLAIVATFGQAIAYPHEDTTQQFSLGAGLILAMNALLGFVVALTFNPMPIALESGSSDEQLGSVSAALRIWPMFGLLIALQVIIGIPISLTLSIGEWTSVFSPLLFGGVLPLIAMLLSWLAALLVVWPLLSLLGALWKLVSGRPVDGLVTKASILFLTLSAFAVTAALGTDYEDRHVRGGLRAILRIWTDETGDPTTMAFRWAARALCLILAVEIIALAIAADRARNLAKNAPEQ